MGAGKSLDLLKVAFNYEEKDKKIMLLTSSLDNRSGTGKITSRVGLSKDAMIINKTDDVVDIVAIEKGLDCILIDEAQFLTKEQVNQLTEIVDFLNIPIICYGLRSDFMLNPFPGSSQLMSVADEIEEIKTICWCGKKASVNARIVDGQIIKHGEQIQIGGNESYESLCRYHYKTNKLYS